MSQGSTVIHDDARNNPVAVKRAVHVRSGLQSERVIIPANREILIRNDIAIRVFRLTTDNDRAQGPTKALRRSQSKTFSQVGQCHRVKIQEPQGHRAVIVTRDLCGDALQVILGGVHLRKGPVDCFKSTLDLCNTLFAIGFHKGFIEGVSHHG